MFVIPSTHGRSSYVLLAVGHRHQRTCFFVKLVARFLAPQLVNIDASKIRCIVNFFTNPLHEVKVFQRLLVLVRVELMKATMSSKTSPACRPSH